MKRMTVALALWMAASGCGGMPPEPDDGPDVAGSIEQFQAMDARQRFLVSGEAWVEVTGESRLWERSGTQLRQIGYEGLQVGDSVRVWYSGPVLESYPVQGVAGTVIVEH